MIEHIYNINTHVKKVHCYWSQAILFKAIFSA